jgi:Ca2+-binding RTX toxin-like protein
MSKEVLMLAIIIIGTTTITATLQSGTISSIGQILPVPSLTTVWALNVTGTPGPDTLSGTAERDTIRGYGGDDILSGLEGNDRIRADRGADTIHGDKGNDRIRGDIGNDVIFGDDGNDILTGGRGNDTLTGGPGKDSFNCGAGGGDTVTDFDPVINDTVMASCENISSSSSPTTDDTSSSPPPTTDDTALDTAIPSAEDLMPNSFNDPLDEENGDGQNDGDLADSTGQNDG